jgi:hypothetical protein
MRANAAEWTRRVAAWRSSGTSAAEYAALMGWTPRTLAWWGAEVSRRGRAGGTSKAGGQASPSPSFVEVVERHEPRPAPPAVPLELVIPRVGTVRISTGADLELLRAVLGALGVGE